jgi:DNA-binding NarL/FixJ family response regulator
MSQQANELMNNDLDKKRVLIAEGDLLEVARLQQLLADHDYSVVAAVTSGEEAVTGAQWLRPDLVLIGLNLEGGLSRVMVAEEIGMTTRSNVIFLGEIDESDAFMHGNRIQEFGYLGRFADDKTVLNVANHLATGTEGIGEPCEWEAEFAAA